MNLSAILSASPNSLSGSLGSGIVTVNGYVISLSETQNGHRLSVSSGNEISFIDISDGEKVDAGRGIAGAEVSAEGILTLTFTDGSAYVSPPLISRLSWENIEDVPNSFAPGTHTHVTGDIDGLDEYLRAARSSDYESRGWHLGFYIDADGDLCRQDEQEE